MYFRNKPLYNGNISATTTSLGSYFTYLYNYRYDQLNRLVDMDTYRGFNATTNSWSGMDGVFYHREHYTYDANGNILRASRNGNLSANQLMDSLHYYYTPGTNRLEYIDDSATTVYGINIDIKDQSPGNYQYDAIGNLVSSVNRPISGIKWNVYGKIVDIQKTAVGNATANYIYYNYDPSGNRIGQVTRHNSGINTIYRYTWYVRDAQGNVIAVYKVADTKTVSSGTLQLAEHHMYGSSRLGIINRDIDADQPKHSADNSNNNLGEAFLINFTRGNKFFELTNHLGNVLSTITDNKLPTPVQNNPLLIASYVADLVTAVDYSPFGMTLPGRVYNNHWRRYRYGFNGQEADHEVQGEYNSYNAEFWQYDPRIGRRWNVDPILKPGESPYAAFSNNPIWNIDPDGADTTKYLSNSQVMDAVKIGYNTINDDVRNRTYNAAKDVSKRLQAAVDAYWDKHQDQFSVGAYAEFRDATFAYHKGLQEVATWSASAWENLGKRITNDNISDQTNLAQTNYTIAHYNGSTAGLVTTGANVALGEAAGGVLFGPGPGPRKPYSSNRAQQMVDASNKLSPYALTPTHGPTLSKSNFIKLKADIQAHGIKESIKYVEYDGVKYVVDGHHRLRIAKELGIKNVPTQEVTLPYSGYKTVSDLQYSRY
ncbi:MAG: RHS repeat-associated core domain-containing protein [Agriterribacter sp.]